MTLLKSREIANGVWYCRPTLWGKKRLRVATPWFSQEVFFRVFFFFFSVFFCVMTSRSWESWMNPLDRREELNVWVFCWIECRCLMCRDSTLVGIVMAFYRMRVAGALLYRYVLIKLLVNSKQLQLLIEVGRDREHPLACFTTFAFSVRINLFIQS